MNTARILLPSLLLASLPGLAAAQATALPLPPAGPDPAAAPMQRQAGIKVIEGPHDERTIIRVFEPDSVVGHYRIDFQALDLDGDGLIDRDEARANPTLEAEFRAVDANNDGRLDRAELSGWIR